MGGCCRASAARPQRAQRGQVEAGDLAVFEHRVEPIAGNAEAALRRQRGHREGGPVIQGFAVEAVQVMAVGAAIGGQPQAIATIIAKPWNAIIFAVFAIALFWHAKLGLQVVIEDYAHKESRFVAMVLLNVFVAAAGGTAIFSILKVAFAGAAA